MTTIDPGYGWRMLLEGEAIQAGDGYFHPDYAMWISFECRPDIFKGSKATGCPKKEYAHTWPWRRKNPRRAAQ